MALTQAAARMLLPKVRADTGSNDLDTVLRGFVDGDFNALAGVTASAAELNALDGITANVDELNTLDGVTATATEINQAADRSAYIQELTATGTVTAGIRFLELNHTSNAIAATIASAANHAGIFVVVDTSASGTAAHTVTLTTGTWNGTNNVATLNARDEMLVVYFDSAGRGHIILNQGSVGLS